MLMRKVEGEEKPWAQLRGRIVTLCDIGRLAKVKRILESKAKEFGCPKGKAYAIWEQLGCADLTQDDGLAKYVETIRIWKDV